MYRIIIAAGLIVLSLLPSSGVKTNLISRLESKVNQPVATVEKETEIGTIKYVDKTENYAKHTANAKAAYFFEAESGEILLTKNADDRLPVASLTKIMTALTVVGKHSLDEKVTIGKIKSRRDDSRMGLVEGDKLTVEQLLEGLLITSGSDAAITLAEYSSGDTSSFVTEMNANATNLGLVNTHFANPVGWDDPQNYSSAHDIAILSKTLLTNETLREIVSKKTSRIESQNGRSYILVNTNKLLGKGYLGIKTGTTYGAGESLAIYYKDQNRSVIGVLIAANERFNETAEIISWVKRSFVLSQQDPSN